MELRAPAQGTWGGSSETDETLRVLDDVSAPSWIIELGESGIPAVGVGNAEVNKHAQGVGQDGRAAFGCLHRLARLLCHAMGTKEHGHINNGGKRCKQLSELSNGKFRCSPK